MGIIDDLKGINKPDEKAKIEFASNPLNELKASYSSWEGIISSSLKEQYVFPTRMEQLLQIAEMLYPEALKLTNHKIRGIKNEEVCGLLREHNQSLGYSGLFLTALLNNFCLDELVIDSIHNLSFIGYKLKRGKIIINADSYNFIGAFASGGVIENHGTINVGNAFDNLRGGFGRWASGGHFINKGTASNIGQHASGGLFENYSTDGEMGTEVSSGKFINWRKLDNLGKMAINGQFYNYGEVSKYLGVYALDGLFVNNGKVILGIGEESRNGIFINNGETFRLGYASYDGLYLNLNEAKSIGQGAANGLFISRTRTEIRHPFESRSKIKVKWWQLFLNRGLRSMLRDLEDSILFPEKLDYLQVQKIVNDIKKNCRLRYK